jgi:hypothetical protein
MLKVRNYHGKGIADKLKKGEAYYAKRRWNRTEGNGIKDWTRNWILCGF